jgi:hypothetical protein
MKIINKSTHPRPLTIELDKYELAILIVAVGRLEAGIANTTLNDGKAISDNLYSAGLDYFNSCGMTVAQYSEGRKNP